MKAARGFSLPELMISLLIGLVLLAGFLSVLAHCRQQFARNDSLARLQDAARQALSVLSDDLEHVGFYGSAAATPKLVRGGATVADAPRLRQDVGVPPVGGLPAGAHDCGVNFAVDVSRPLEGANNVYAVGRDARDCAPTASAGGARVGADTLTLRHASLAATAAHAGRVQLYSRRLASLGDLDLFADGDVPGVVAEDAQVRDLEVHVYYVANNSVDRPGFPALRVKSLTESRGAAQFRDEEVLPGVEDLQVEFAVSDGARVSWVAPDSSLVGAGRVIAVRFWLRIRSDSTEGGFVDARPMTYADVSFTPTPLEAKQRRLLVGRTVALRNVAQ